jgi:hypothetical protein
MAPTPFKTVALLVAALTLTAAPSFAQRNGRRDGGEGGRRDGGAERAQPRDGGGERDRSRDREAPRAERRDERRDYGRVERARPVEPSRAYRPYVGRPYAARPYTYRPYVYRNYASPFGYRPYGYRPGWSLNLYFGRPTYGYGYGYPAPAYGYYSLIPGRAYGSLRIVDAPRDAQVFVDGYYAGVVDDYDGVFQHLNLEAGSHHIEIEEDGYPALAFDVRIEPGQTITYRANIQ